MAVPPGYVGSLRIDESASEFIEARDLYGAVLLLDFLERVSGVPTVSAADVAARKLGALRTVEMQIEVVQHLPRFAQLQSLPKDHFVQAFMKKLGVRAVRTLSGSRGSVKRRGIPAGADLLARGGRRGQNAGLLMRQGIQGAGPAPARVVDVTGIPMQLSNLVALGGVRQLVDVDRSRS